MRRVILICYIASFLTLALFFRTFSTAYAQNFDVQIDGDITYTARQLTIEVQPGVNIREISTTLGNEPLFIENSVKIYAIVAVAADEQGRGNWYQIVSGEGIPVGWVSGFINGTRLLENEESVVVLQSQVRRWFLEDETLPENTTRIAQDESGILLAYVGDVPLAFWYPEEQGQIEAGQWMHLDEFADVNNPDLASLEVTLTLEQVSSLFLSDAGAVLQAQNPVFYEDLQLSADIAQTQDDIENLNVAVQRVENLVTGQPYRTIVFMQDNGIYTLLDENGNWQHYIPPYGYTAQLTAGFEHVPYIVFYNAQGNNLPVVEGIIPVRDTRNPAFFRYEFEKKLLAQYNEESGIFIDSRAGLPIWNTVYTGYGEVKGSVLGQENPDGDYFVYGYRILDSGRIGNQIVPAHIVEEIRLFREKTIPVILGNVSDYATLAERTTDDPYKISEFDWSQQNLERRLLNWGFPNYLNTIIPPPGAVETTIGRLRHIIEGGSFVDNQAGGPVWQSAGNEILLMKLSDLQAFLTLNGETHSYDTLVTHILGGIARDDTLSAIQRFMLLSAIYIADGVPIVIDSNGESLYTSPDSIFISLDPTSIWASLHYHAPQQMRSFLIHELGGHGPELWGTIHPCDTTTNGKNRRNRIEPVRYITELNDLLVTNPDPNPDALRHDYSTTAATVMIFTRFPQNDVPGSCALPAGESMR